MKNRILSVLLLIGILTTVIPHEFLHHHDHQEGGCAHEDHIQSFQVEGVNFHQNQEEDCTICDYLQTVQFFYLPISDQVIRSADSLVASIVGQPEHEIRSFESYHTGRGPPQL